MPAHLCFPQASLRSDNGTGTVSDAPPLPAGKDPLDTLMPHYYAELRRLAHACLAAERHDHTLQPTALVHETYLRFAARHNRLVLPRPGAGPRLHHDRRILVTRRSQKRQKSDAWRRGPAPDLSQASARFSNSSELANQRRGLAVRQAILDAHPGITRAMHATAISHEYLGDILAAMNRCADAAREQRTGLRLIEAVADPRNVDHHSIVAGGSQRLCEYLARTGHWRDAFEACEKSPRIDRTMAAADPNNVQALEDLASATSTMSLA